MSRKLPWAEIIVITLVVAAGAGVYLYAHKDEGRLEQSKEQGEELVTALHAYHDEYGTYPEQLDELVPRHIAAVSPPAWGLQRWRYRRYAVGDSAAMPADEPMPDSAAAPIPDSADASMPDSAAAPIPDSAAAPMPDSSDVADAVFFQLSVAANESGYPVLYYDLAARRWVLNN